MIPHDLGPIPFFSLIGNELPILVLETTARLSCCGEVITTTEPVAFALLTNFRKVKAVRIESNVAEDGFYVLLDDLVGEYEDENGDEDD